MLFFTICLGSLNLTRLQALCANINLLRSTVNYCLHRLDV